MAEEQVYMSAVKTVCKTTDSEGCPHCIHFQRFPSTTACEEAYNRRIVQKQLQHPSICQVYEVQREGDSVRTDMEWCGQALHTLQRAWTQEDCWHLLCSVSAALAYAQHQGVAHGFLQPGVMYCTEEGYYKVGNFGCVTCSTDVDYLISIQQPIFLSPEVRQAFVGLLLGENAKETSSNTYKSDVYSLGITILSLLNPQSLSTWGNFSAVQTTVSSLPLHCTFQSLLMRMLETEVRRPDWRELEEAVWSTQQATAEAIQNSPQKSAKKRLRVIKRPKVTEMTAISAQACILCNASFVLNNRDPWRLDLIGSTSSQEAVKYCSSPCFQQSTRPPKAKAPPHSTIAEVFTGLYAEYVGDEDLQRPYLQFYHCFRHTVYSSALNHTDGPTVLAACPECPSGDISSEVVFGVQVQRNSLYPSLIFIQEYMETVVLWFSIATAFREVLLAAQCHICGKGLQPGSWMSFFHGERLDLACCPCFLRAMDEDTCPTCGLPVEKFEEPAYREASESKKMRTLDLLKGRILARSEAWCYLCCAQPAQWMLPCGHSSCLACLSLQPHLPEVDSFGCMYCGCVIPKQDHPDLMLQLGRG